MDYVVTEGRKGRSMIQVSDRLVGACEKFGEARWVFYSVEGTMLLVEDFAEGVDALAELDRKLWI